MFKRVHCCAVAVLALSAGVAFGESKDDLQSAMTKLADAASYSWTTTVEGGMNAAGPTEGKTEKDGLTWVQLPARNATFEVFMKGKAVAIKTDAGWKTAAEITAAAPAGGGGGGGGARRSPEAVVAAQAANFATPSGHAKDLATKLENVKKTDDGFTADYTEAAAKELLQFRGGGRGGANAPAMEVTNPKGTLAVTVKDGAATKIVVHVTGSMTIGGNARDIDRTTTTEIKDVGATKIEVPEEAKKKLDEKPAM